MTASVSTSQGLSPRTERATDACVTVVRPRRRLLRVVLGVTSASLLATGLIGALHLPFAAPLLRAISPASLCPVTRGTPAQIDRAHALGAASVRAASTSEAPSRPALGFALDRTTRSDLEAWAARHHVSCESIRGNDNLRRCTAVPARALGHDESLGPVEEVTFELASSGQLVHVETLRRGLPAARAAAIAKALEESLAGAVGAPGTTGGEPSAAHLSHGLFASYVAEHAFNDYRATVSATNLDKTGVMVRESYLSARP